MFTIDKRNVYEITFKKDDGKFVVEVYETGGMHHNYGVTDIEEARRWVIAVIDTMIEENRLGNN